MIDHVTFIDGLVTGSGLALSVIALWHLLRPGSLYTAADRDARKRAAEQRKGAQSR